MAQFLPPPLVPLPQCSIDLKKNVLVIGTTGTQTTFLPEGELPECARLAYGAGREDVRPEEMADQELAEAIQKSVDEAGTSGARSRQRKSRGASPVGSPLWLKGSRQASQNCLDAAAAASQCASAAWLHLLCGLGRQKQGPVERPFSPCLPLPSHSQAREGSALFSVHVRMSIRLVSCSEIRVR